MTPEDIARLEDEERQRKTAAGINVAQHGRNPHAVAVATELARKYNVEPALIESDPEPFKQMDVREQADSMLDEHPWMTPHLIENADVGAMMTSGDFSKLSNISGALGMDRSKQQSYTFKDAAPKLTPAPPPKPMTFRDLLTSSAKQALMAVSPTLAAALGAAPKVQAFANAGVADYKRSGETAPEYLSRYARAAPGQALLGVAGTAHGILGLAELGTSTTLGAVAGEDPLYDWYRQQDAVAAATEKLYTPEWAKTDFQKGVLSGMQSITQMALTAPLGEGAVWGLGAVTAGQAEAKYRERGAGAFASAAGALSEGAIEVITEKYLGGFGKKGYLTSGEFLHPSMRKFGSYLWHDVIGEQLATAGQNLTDFLVPGSETKSWKQYLEESPSQAMQTLWATLTMGGVIGATGAARQQFAKLVGTHQDAVEGIHGQAILEEIMKNAAETPLRTASPQAFAEMIDAGAKNSPVKNVFIPVEAIDKALADETLPDDEREALTVYQSQIDEARTNGGEVVIPIGEAAARLSGTKVWEKIKDDARVLSGGISAREAREHLDNLVNDLERVGEEATKEVNDMKPAFEAKQKVYDEVKAQVLKAGRSEREAQTTAALLASRAETLASDRYGQFKDAHEAWKWMQLQIVGPSGKAKGRARKVAQSAFAEPASLLNRNDWAIMTAENPNARPLPPEQNAERMAQLKATLEDMGLSYTEVRGKYDNEENSLAIEGITQQQAQELGRRFGQESVLTPAGLVYGDNTVNPARGVNILDKDAENYFTELPTGVKFTVDIDFDQRVPLVEAHTFQQSDLTPLEQVASAPGALEVAKSKQFANMRDFKMQLQDMVKATKVGNLRDPKRLTRLALADARLALQNNSNAIGWYGEKMEQAMEVLGQLHPEINTDPDARFAFIYALSVTSQGLKVERNFKLADIVYREYKKNGRMPEDIGEGTSKKIMQNSLKLFNQLTEKMTVPELRDFMLAEHTVGEVEKKLGVTVTGEHKGTKVKGAAVLGPKIGNGYFSNLYGDFTQLTMDRWFIRTWGRWTASLVNVDKTAVTRHTNRLKEQVRNLSAEQKRAVEKLLSTKRSPFKIKLGEIEDFAKKISLASSSADVRDALKAVHPRLRLDAMALAKTLDGQKEAPQGPAERNEIRAIFGPVLSELQTDNPELTMADLQAVLWYPEKTLYDTAKAKAGTEAKIGYENDEAPDYANAAVALARSEGVNEEKINAALERARGRVSAARRAKRAGRGDRAGNRRPIIIPEDANGFPLEDVLTTQGNGLTDPTVYQQFGGQLGAINDIRTNGSLIRAEQLEGEMTPEELWEVTGWMRGADGQWRFEIDDGEAQLQSLPSPEPLRHSEATPGIDYMYSDPRMVASEEDGELFLVGERLEKVLFHPKLFKFYPHLRNMPVFMADLPGNILGYFDGYSLVLRADKSAAETLSTLMHEIQHGIQAFEGFANGAEASVPALYQLGLGAAYEAEFAHFKAIARGEIPGMRFSREMSDEQLSASAAFAIYERVAGEVEARNTQARMQLSKEERKKTFPELTTDFDRENVLLPQQDFAIAAQSTTGPLPPRGETSFYPDGRTIVQLFKADFSTMLHEMSHVFLEQEFKLSQQKGASEELKADIESLRKWFAEHNANFEGTTEEKTAAHELFARTGERYFREGKAPSAELRSSFKQFREWLTGVYKSVKDLLSYGPSPINPEIRQIFDRMIATEQAISNEATQPMSQEELGMTSAEYEAYLDSVTGAQDRAFDILLERMMKAIRQRDQKAIKAQRGNVRDEVAQQVNSDPRFIALHLLRTGRWLNEPGRERTEVKINTGWLIDNYGEEILKQLPVGLQPLHRGDGVEGDTIAAMVGLPSGDALVKALVDLKGQADRLKADGNPRPLRDQIIEDETDRIMGERHGDIAMSEDDIREEAIAAINSNRQGEVLATELRQLKKKAAQPGVVTPYQILREWARRKAYEGTVADAVSKETLNRYIRLYNKARTAFENALIKGDEAEAIKQKQAQMINHALLAEGKKVADDIDAIVNRMQRYARTKALASIEQDYMDRIHELLEGYNFRTVSDAKRAEKASFEDWAARQREAGSEVYVPERFRDDRVNWKDAQVSKLLELNDMVQSLAHLGKLKQKLVIAAQERHLEELRDEAEASVLALPERKLGEASTGETTRPLRQRIQEAKTFRQYREAITDLFRPGTRVRQAAAGLVKIEGVADILDQTKMGTGAFNQLLIRGATDAANEYSSIREEVLAKIADAYHSMGGKMAARLNNFVTIPELKLNAGLHPEDPRRGKPLNITRKQLLALVANTGNLSNLSKLVGGEGWGDPESMSDMIKVQQTLISYLNKEEMDLVQSLWDAMDKLWPHIARVERQLTGVVPESVVPMEVQTPWGPYHGGYWPVVWDSERTNLGKPDEETSEANLFGVGSGLGTYKGHTITRTGAMGPMDWSLDRVLFARTNQVISRIAYAPWIRDSLKLINSPRVAGAIRLRMGPEYLGALKSWMRDQIPSNMPSVQGAKFWEQVLNATRINMTATVLGISYSTGVAQTLGLTYSAGVLGEGNVGEGPRWLAAGFQKMISLWRSDGPGPQEFVFSRSEEMRRRAHELNREVMDVFQRLDDKRVGGIRRAQRWIQARAFWHIAFIDLNTVSIPTWLGGYEKAKAQGQSEEDAAAYADKVVRLSQGSGREKDMSAIQRGNAGQRFISMFYTPSSVFFNQQWEAAQHMKAGNWSKALAPTFWFLMVNTLADAYRNGDWPPEDDDGNVDIESVAKWVARNLLFGMFYGVPIARDVANTANRKIRGQYADWGSTPLTYGIQSVAKGASAAGKMVRGEDIEGSDIKNEATAVGWLLGLPGAQAGKTAGFVEDVRSGKAEPQGISDWFTGLTTGKMSEKE